MTTLPPPPHRPPPFPTWHSRELPVLLEVATIVNNRGVVNPRLVAESVGLETDDVKTSISWLLGAGYLIEDKSKVQTDGYGAILIAEQGWLTPSEKGLRQVGFWPSEQTALDQLLARLQAIVDNTSNDPDTRSRARRILDALAGTGRDLGVQVVATVLASHLGVPPTVQLTQPPAPPN